MTDDVIIRDVPSEVPVFVVKKKLDDTSIAPTATDLLDLIRLLVKYNLHFEQIIDFPYLYFICNFTKM